MCARAAVTSRRGDTKWDSSIGVPIFEAEPRRQAMKTSGSAIWSGGIRDGKGAISTQSGALKEYPYGFASRFEGKPGTNPEELIGAAHAGWLHHGAVAHSRRGEAHRRTDGDPRPRSRSKARRRLRHHRGAPDPERQGPRRRSGQVRGARQQGQGRPARCRSCSTPRSQWKRCWRREGHSAVIATSPRCRPHTLRCHPAKAGIHRATEIAAQWIPRLRGG